MQPLPFLALLGALIIGAHQALAEAPEHSITVSGQGTATLTADRASMTLTVDEAGDDVAAMEQSVGRRIGRMLEAFREQGVADNDLAATRISIQPRSRYDQGLQRSVPDGYLVERTLTVTVRDLTRLSDTILTATRLGVTRLSPPVLASSQRESAYRDALGQAVEQARERALVLATAAGRHLGKATRITTQPGHLARPSPVMAMARQESRQSSPFQPGALDVYAHVTVVFELLEAPGQVPGQEP